MSTTKWWTGIADLGRKWRRMILILNPWLSIRVCKAAITDERKVHSLITLKIMELVIPRLIVLTLQEGEMVSRPDFCNLVIDQLSFRIWILILQGQVLKIMICRNSVLSWHLKGKAQAPELMTMMMTIWGLRMLRSPILYIISS